MPQGLMDARLLFCVSLNMHCAASFEIVELKKFASDLLSMKKIRSKAIQNRIFSL